MDLNKEELALIRKAMQSYILHLQPSATYVREIADWLQKVNEVQNKVSKILLIQDQE